MTADPTNPTRRRVLAALALSSAAFRSAVAADAVSPAMARLSEYMSAAKTRPLPAEVIEKAKHHILDTLAAMVSGAQLAPGRVAIAFARAQGGKPVATVAGSDVVCGPIEAALANGILAHSDETDDYAPLGTHPGAPVVPATLAIGEQMGVDGVTFLRAVTLGYDLANRVANVLGGLTLDYEGHKSIHSITGVFGAAAAAGSVAGLSTEQMRWLLDYSAQQASGIAAWRRDTDHIEKAFVYGGGPARGGVTAVLLLQAGATGVADVLSGSDNFLLAFAPKADPALLTDELGKRYEIAVTSIKKWTVGGPIQAVLDSVENLKKRNPFTADQVEHVEVNLGPGGGGTVNNRDMPDICVQHLAAVMLLDGTVSFAAAHDRPRMRDASVLRQRAKVELVLKPELERTTDQREAIVEITLAGGTRLREHVTTVRGTPGNPMPREEVVAKATDLITPVVGPAKCEKLVARILDLENVRDVRELRPFLQP